MVETFIENFKKGFNARAIEECFLYGNCYWFAKILELRFSDSKIYYSPVENHFITKIQSKYYDIRGLYRGSLDSYVDWEEYKVFEPLDAARVIRDCVNKENINEI